MNSFDETLIVRSKQDTKIMNNVDIKRPKAPYAVNIYHNILWPKYKGSIFSGLHDFSLPSDINISFFQIAKTTEDRLNLGEVDFSYHRYPYKLLFNSTYDSIPKFKLCKILFTHAAYSDANLVLLPGYHLLEYWFMLLACILTGKKRAVFVDSTSNDQPDAFFKHVLKRLFFSFCDGFFGYGQRSKEYLMSFGVPEEKITTRCQAAALTHDYSPESALSNRIQRRTADMPAHYLFVGVLVGKKGIDTLIKAFHQIYQKDRSALLTIAGDGELHDELRMLVASLQLSDAVNFTGALHIDSLQNHYLQASCLVLPSRSEAWGLVVNEALSYGCPAIVSDRCGCAPDLIVEGETGYVFNTDDVADLAGKMALVNTALNDVPKVANDCITLMQKFTPEKAAAQILKGCHAILTKQGGQ
jgi:glycosyltransferase involved in cell wall biosynthesis